MHCFSFSGIALAILLFSCCSAFQNKELVNNNVQRNVDLTSHLTKITSTITLENTGKSAVDFFLFALEPELAAHFSYIGAVAKGRSGEDKKLQNAAFKGGDKDKTIFKITLASPLDGGQQVTVDVEVSYSHTLLPYPSEIEQNEKQLVKYRGSSLFYSPYKTIKETTIVNCASSTIESHTKTNPVKVSDSVITYGPYENTAPFALSEMVIHYENNTPFLTVTHLDRLIEVSHWGNIAVEDTIDIRHSGAKLKGSFSRYDYQRQQDGLASVKVFKTVLPTSARDVYYRDEIGNISTSNLREMDDMVEVELRPRFPLFGGWKTHYLLGYNVPSYQYLFNNGDDYMLKMRFVDHIYDDEVIDEMTLRIILPEGSKNIKFTTPYSVSRDSDELLYTYLDTVGRPVIIAKKTDLVEQHIQDFKLKYTFPKYMLIQEPMLLVGAFYLLFITVIIYVRLDFSISKDEASESRMRVASLLEQLTGLQIRRSALYQTYDDAIDKYKSSKDHVSFTANRKKIDGSHKQLSHEIDLILDKLTTEESDMSDKVSELQQLDRKMREQISLSAQLAVNLVGGKLGKQQYVDQDENIRGKRRDISQKMESLAALL